MHDLLAGRQLTDMYFEILPGCCGAERRLAAVLVGGVRPTENWSKFIAALRTKQLEDEQRR